MRPKQRRLEILAKTVAWLLLLFGAMAVRAGDKLLLTSGPVDPSALEKESLLSEGPEGRLFVIQYKNTISSFDKKQLENAGIEVKGYVPEDALLVNASSQAVLALRSSKSSIRAIVPFRAEWKISNALKNKQICDAPEAVKVHVRTLQGEDIFSIERDVQDLSVQVGYANYRSLVVEVLSERVLDIASLDGVEWIEPLAQIKLAILDDPELSNVPPEPPPRGDYTDLTGFETGTKVMGFQKAWDLGFHGEGQVVAVADTGLDTGIEPTLSKDFSGFIKGYAMGMFSKSWGDPQGHGTHVSGSVLGKAVAASGALRGGAYKAELIMEGLWSPMMGNITIHPDFSVLMGEPYKEGARIHTNSWGSASSFGNYDNMSAQADDFLWQNMDMLIVFAAGNAGADWDQDGRIDEGTVSPPATAKNVLTVGASENLLLQGGYQTPLSQLRQGEEKWGVEPLRSDKLSDNPKGLAGFSSRGPTNDGRIKPDIVAPGTNIISARSHDPEATELWGAYNSDYVYAGGTSMSTPLVAGAAAVVRQILIESWKIPNPSGMLVKAMLLHSAKDLFPGQFGEGAGQELLKRRPNVHEGYGRVDLEALLGLNNQNTILLDDIKGVETGQTKTLKVKILRGMSLRVTLSYFDAPSSPSVAKALVNDLDLVVMGGGEVFKLNDHVNNTEMLELSGLKSGEYQVLVKGKSVPMGKEGRQPFSLVVTRE